MIEIGLILHVKSSAEDGMMLAMLKNDNQVMAQCKLDIGDNGDFGSLFQRTLQHWEPVSNGKQIEVTLIFSYIEGAQK